MFALSDVLLILLRRIFLEQAREVKRVRQVVPAIQARFLGVVGLGCALFIECRERGVEPTRTEVVSDEKLRELAQLRASRRHFRLGQWWRAVSA